MSVQAILINTKFPKWPIVPDSMALINPVKIKIELYRVLRGFCLFWFFLIIVTWLCC